MNRILHLGLGAFHRAHQAVYLQRLHDLGANDWTLAGGNIRGDMSQTMEALVAQRGEYTLETIAPNGATQYERIRSIRQIVPFDPQLEALIELGCRDPALWGPLAGAPDLIGAIRSADREVAAFVANAAAA